MTWIAPQSPPGDAARIHEHRRQLLLVRGYFDDLAGFPADTQANILTRLRELADLTGEPMLTHDQTEALVRKLDDALTRIDALESRVTDLTEQVYDLAHEVDRLGENTSEGAFDGV